MCVSYNIITLRIYIDVKLSTLQTKATESSTNLRTPQLQIYRYRYSASVPKQRTFFYTATTRDTFLLPPRGRFVIVKKKLFEKMC